MPFVNPADALFAPAPRKVAKPEIAPALITRNWSLPFVFLFILLTNLAQTTAPAPLLCGTLQTTPIHAREQAQAGMTVGMVEVSWDRFEPHAGQFDSKYIAQIQQHMTALRTAKLRLVLDLGLQYPPAWVFELPHSRFVNQFGESFTAQVIGGNGLNAVFNNALRQRQAAYVAQVFRELGIDFYAVRLGWGHYGELHYPNPKTSAHTNAYWAYDPIAQGIQPGLPSGLKPCPVPGWIPGQTSPDHRSAVAFLDWYHGALQNYHDWQITTVRKLYPGSLLMLYPSWGLRPGEIKAATQGDLAGTTSPERNGEVQRGYDFVRLIAGITDRDVVVYCTWLDASSPYANDASPNPAHWTPPHYLCHLADTHPLKLRKWGENTGPGGKPETLALCFQRARDYHMLGFFWAFEKDLYTGQSATLTDFTTLLNKPLPASK